MRGNSLHGNQSVHEIESYLVKEALLMDFFILQTATVYGNSPSHGITDLPEDEFSIQTQRQNDSVLTVIWLLPIVQIQRVGSHS